MHDRGRLLAGMVALSCSIAGCTKTASDTPADTASTSASTAATTDRSADERTIIALDSGWMRNVMAKNVDSLMTYYASDAVSFGFGPPATGPDQIRGVYTEFVKSTMSEPKINSNTVKFSDDGSMAYDYGTYSMTVTPPGGKPANADGAFLNVWRKVDGQWKLAAEMSTPVAAPKS